MADAPPPDPYATAKANLRETIKWLATTLAAVGAAVVAGVSITGLSALEGRTLFTAAVLGALGLLLILYTVGKMLSLLSSNVFYFSSLLEPNNPITQEIDAHARDVLPPQTPSIAALVGERDRALKDADGKQPDDPEYIDAQSRYVEADAWIGRVTDLAQFLALRNALRDRQGELFFYTALIIFCLGGYAVLASGKKSVGDDQQQAVVFNPGPDWSAAAAAYAKACGSEKREGVMTSQKTFAGWVAVRLSGPGKCAGLELAAPASLVQLTGATP